MNTTKTSRGVQWFWGRNCRHESTLDPETLEITTRSCPIPRHGACPPCTISILQLDKRRSDTVNIALIFSIGGVPPILYSLLLLHLLDLYAFFYISKNLRYKFLFKNLPYDPWLISPPFNSDIPFLEKFHDSVIKPFYKWKIIVNH